MYFPLRRCKSRELRGGILYRDCECVRRNGLQDDCPRTDCNLKFTCLRMPKPICCPGRNVQRFSDMEFGQQNHRLVDKFSKGVIICPP